MDKKEFSSFACADSLRKTLKMLKSFYDCHTKENVNVEDINGCKYYGCLQNFGSELLLESRKILMNKPSLRNLFAYNTFDFYFDIQYSELINTYEQQSLLHAILKKDVLLSNRKYYIQFEDCVDEIVLRADSSSDPSVYKDTFVKTSTPPKLIVMDGDDVESEIILKLSDKTDVDTVYYFYINKVTESIVDTYEDGVLKTVMLDDSMFDLPFIWICVDIFRLLPNIDFDDNIDINGKSLLTVGTDGHDKSYLYPYVYGEENVPADKDDIWFIKVYPREAELFVDTMNPYTNYNKSIEKIVFINSTGINATPNHVNEITFDHEFVKILLSNKVNWKFRKPVVGEYDYDGLHYNNDYYAYIELNEFIGNMNDDELLEAFVVSFDDMYLHAYEKYIGNAVSGIHVDSATEYTTHSIDKKNGVIHSLGDFDGLPPYFKYLLDRTIHRTHVELYSIRDDLNNVNQKVDEKQTSALIIDTGVPQIEMDSVLEGLDVVIKYSNNRKYITDGESVSPINSISQVTYLGGNEFGNVLCDKQASLDKFIYHGGRTFSMGIIDLDPYLEMGRVYCISNDPSYYENNATCTFTKPPRTIARICDIPTSFTQLTSVENKAPTLVIDKEYVRTECDFNDSDMLWNGLNKSNGYVTYNDSIIINHDDIEKIDEDYLFENYTFYCNTNEFINLINVDYYEYTISVPGIHYAVGDIFTIMIGGMYINGMITDVALGVPTAFEMASIGNTKIQLSNLDGRVSTFKTHTKTGSGVGLEIVLTFDESLWNAMQQSAVGIIDGLCMFAFDEFNNVFVHSYKDGEWNESYQLTGDEIIDNYYDEFNQPSTRKLNDVMLRNQLILNNKILDDSTVFKNHYETTTIMSDSELDATDYSDYILKKNSPNRYYKLLKNQSLSVLADVCDINRNDNIDECLLFPYANELNLKEYYNKSNRLLYVDNGKQPSVCYFNPCKDTIDVIDKYTNKYGSKTSRLFTFNDLYDGIMDEKTGILLDNVYHYDELQLSDKLIELRSALDAMNRDDVVDYMMSHGFEEARPFLYEHTEHAFKREMLIDYIMQNSYDDVIYEKHDVSLLRKQNEQVMNVSNIVHEPIGEQPMGGMDTFIETIDPNVSINKSKALCEILYIFKLDTNEVDDLTGFEMVDEYGNNINRQSLLIFNKKKYVSDGIRWILV